MGSLSESWTGWKDAQSSICRSQCLQSVAKAEEIYTMGAGVSIASFQSCDLPYTFTFTCILIIHLFSALNSNLFLGFIFGSVLRLVFGPVLTPKITPKLVQDCYGVLIQNLIIGSPIWDSSLVSLWVSTHLKMSPNGSRNIAAPQDSDY